MRAEKQFLLDEIKEKIDASTAFLVASYDKLPPNEGWGLRAKLAECGSLLEVVRKRVFVKAALQAGIQIDESLLKGHIGVVFINDLDPMAPAKALMKYSEENAKSVSVVLGKIEGKIVPGADVEALSRLPGRDEMRAQILALFVSPMAQMLAVVDAAMAGPLSVLEQQSQKE
ncbi:MAG: 50S ribosomal protein L10 [Verrucomicrobiota bacterium]|nr:50S ribosomal protein L10 [Verrucomicrobiota bacterium]